MKFPYTPTQGASDLQQGLPFVPITLAHSGRSISVNALIDSGSTINLLPSDIGLQLGLSWDSQNFPLTFVGNLRGVPAHGIVLRGQLGAFPPVKLAFAWVEMHSSKMPVILGQINFFQIFRVCFDGDENVVAIVPKKNHQE